MRAIKILLFSLCIISTIFLVLFPLLYASGYHPPFDEAVAEAELIVLGKVIEAWKPKEKLTGKEVGHELIRVYRMKVEKVYKGKINVGEEVIFIDPCFLTTASYHVREGKMNLTFLISKEFPDYDRKHIDYGTSIFYKPIDNLAEDSENNKYEGWLFLLDLTVMNPPEDLIKRYRSILREEDNRYVLNYVIEHWPEKLTKEDETLFREVIMKYADDSYIADPAIERLPQRNVKFNNEELIDLIKNGSPYIGSKLLELINSDNIGICKQYLFEWLKEDYFPRAWQTIKVLTKYCPDYLKERLREEELPLEILITSLQELNINGSDIGKEDFSPQILALNPSKIEDVMSVYKGKMYNVIHAMKDPEQYSYWKEAFSLLEPVLTESDSLKRRLVVALLRTFGIDVKRKGRKYVIVEGTEPVLSPVRIEIEPSKKTFEVGEPIGIIIREIGAKDDIWFSFKGEMEWRLDCDNGTYYRSDAIFGAFDNVNIPREKFVNLKKGQVVETIKEFQWHFSPAIYKISAKKLYPYDGGQFDLDAWTGVLFSNEIEIEIVDKQGIIIKLYKWISKYILTIPALSMNYSEPCFRIEF